MAPPVPEQRRLLTADNPGDAVRGGREKPNRGSDILGCSFFWNSLILTFTTLLYIIATVVSDAFSLVSGRYASHFTLFTKNSFGSNMNPDCVMGQDFELVGAIPISTGIQEDEEVSVFPI